MWHGLTFSGLLKLLAQKPRFGWSYVPRWASIFVMSVANSIQNGMEWLLYARKIRATTIDLPPVFILGHWRSGTTMLHNLMVLDPEVTYPNLYTCLYPGHFLLTESIMAPLTEKLLPETRPQDNIPVSWYEPQEEDIALALDCLISPYMIAAFYDEREKYERFFDSRDMLPHELKAFKASFLKLMKKLTIRRNARIVTKNPGHTLKIPVLLEMFPDAYFIYIRRDPYDVFRSTVHNRTVMIGENKLGPVSMDKTESDTLYFYEKTIRAYEETKGMIPPGRLHELRYEDLEADPLHETQRIYEALQLPGWERVEPKLSEQLPKLKAYKKNAFRMDRATMEMVYSRVQWVFDLYGYPSRMEDASQPHVATPQK
ncbi:MAG: sulfotransferase family protein [Planctomycetota bacterium]